MDFDPNKKGKPVYEWATYIPERRPQFKAHRNVGHAKNAFKYRSDAILYHWEEGEWVEKYRVEDLKSPDTCDWCSESTITYHYRRAYNAGDWYWPKNGKLHMEYLCRDCSLIHNYGDKGNARGEARINSYYSKKILDLILRKVGSENLAHALTTKSEALYDKSIQELIDAGMAKETYRLIEQSFDWSTAT